MRGYLIIISLLALALSIMAFFGCSVSVTLEGGALALISICATLIVGVHILDSVRISQMEQKLKELSKIKEDLEGLRANSNIALNITWGLVFLKDNLFNSFKHFVKAYSIAIAENDAKRVRTCKQCLDKWKEKMEKEDGQKRERIVKKIKKEYLQEGNSIDEIIRTEIEDFVDFLSLAT